MPSLYLFFRWLKIVSFLNFRLSTNLCTSRTKSAISKRQSAAAASSSKTSFVCQTPSKTRPSFVSKNTFISVAPIFVPSQHPYCLILRQKRVFHVPIIPCFCHFATLIPHFSANLHLCIFPNIPASAAFLSDFPQAICMASPRCSGKRRFFSRSSHKQSAWHRPRCSGKRRFLGKKALKDVTRRTGLLAQHIFPDASLLFFVLFSNKTKTSLSHATNFKKLYGKFFHYF